MGYRVTIAEEACPHCGHYPEPALAVSHTYNVAPMFYLAFGPDGLKSLDGKSKDSALKILEPALKYFTANAEYLRTVEPANGWGSYDGALRLLRDIRDALESGQNLTVTVS